MRFIFRIGVVDYYEQCIEAENREAAKRKHFDSTGDAYLDSIKASKRAWVRSYEIIAEEA